MNKIVRVQKERLNVLAFLMEVILQVYIMFRFLLILTFVSNVIRKQS